jgi:hypothetical protein
MKLGACVLATALAVTLGGSARAEDGPPDAGRPPPTGIDALGSGGALAAIGTLMFASAPICKTAVVNTPQQGSCFTVSFAVGTPFLVLGIPILVYGAMEHGRYKEWARRHPALSGLSLSPTSRGGAVGWSAAF